MHADRKMGMGASSRYKRCARAPLAAAVALCLAGVAPAATITVNDSRGDPPNSHDITCSLPDAVAAVNAAAAYGGCAAGDGNNDRILLSFTTSTTIQFSVPSSGDNNSALSIAKPVSIVGATDANHIPLVTLKRSTVSGTPNFRLIGTSADLTLDGVSLINGNVAESGGAVRATGYAAVSLSDAKLSGNSAAVSGGGVAVDCGALSLYRATVTGNTAGKSGGGVYVSDYMKNSVCEATAMHIAVSTVSNNTATGGSGGGAFSFNGYATIRGSTINGNTAQVNGGGVYAYQRVELAASTISNNTGQSGNGGGVSSNTVTTTGGNSVISGNTAHIGAGGIFAHSVNLAGITVSGNKSVYSAGGIYAVNDATLVNSTVVNNASGYCECRSSGGLFAASATVTNSTFTGNFGGYFGYGGIYTTGDVNLYFNTISGNRGSSQQPNNRGGGVGFFGSAYMVGNIISGNTNNDVYTYPAKTVAGGFNIVGTFKFVTLPGDTITDCAPGTGLNLGPLADNGGPTNTMALLDGSCAIDAGPSTTPLPGGVSTDQRGLRRPYGTNADIGAFELQPDVIFAGGFE